MFGMLLDMLGFGAKPDPVKAEAEYYAKVIVNELTRKGLAYVRKFRDGGQELEQIKISGCDVYPDRFEFEIESLPYGVDYKDLRKDEVLENLSTRLRKVVEIKHGKGLGFRYVVKRAAVAKRSNFYFQELVPPKNYDPLKTPLLIPVGRDEKGNQVWADLATMPHALIGGATGGGKSMETHGILCWLISNTSPDRVQVIIIDLKGGLDWARYDGVPHLLMPVAYKHDDALERLKWIETEIERRSDLFRPYQAHNLESYVKRSGQTLAEVVFIFDEFANVNMFKSSDDKEWAWRLIKDGSQRARALGIHFIIITQRPSVKIIDGDTRMNYPARFAFSMPTSIDSRVILDNDLATQLAIGDFIFQYKNEGVLLRGLYFAPVNGDELYQVDELILTVKSKWQAQSELNKRAKKASDERREQLVNDLIRYSATTLRGEFTVNTLYEAFKGRTTKKEVFEIARELEEDGMLEKGQGSIPRMLKQKKSPPNGTQIEHKTQ